MKIEILTSPYSKGTLVGDGGGPAAVLHAGLLATLRADGHDVTGPRVAALRSRASAGDQMAVIEEAGASLSQLVREARSRGAFCLVLEGDCTAAPAVIAGLEADRSEEHTSELQSPYDLVCRLLLEKKKALQSAREPFHVFDGRCCEAARYAPKADTK